MANVSRTSSQSIAQEVYIDLPGEAVRCWRSSDNMRVTLRKHRDVIFDLNLGGGKTYIVESEQSDFYNANAKKIVFAKRRETVSFQDGCRLHLWVTRGFKGALMLKCNNQLLMRIEPNKFDKHDYGQDPKTKPAPIIVALGDTHSSPGQASDSRARKSSTARPVERPAAAQVDEQCALVCVVDGTSDGAPSGLLNLLKNGGGKSGLVDIDPYEVASRNWILGQLAAASAFVGDNWKWLRASIDGKTSEGLKLVKAKVHFVKGKIRFYFSGYSKFNAIFGPGGFGSNHQRILEIFAGAGKAASTFVAAGKALLGTVKGYALVAIVFGSVTAYSEWKDDQSKDGYDLAASLMTTILKTLLSAALTAIIVSLIVALIMVAGSVSAPVIVVGAIVIGVGGLVSYGIDALDKSLGRKVTGDKNADGMSTVMARQLRAAADRVEQNFIYLVRKFVLDYKEMSE